MKDIIDLATLLTMQVIIGGIRGVLSQDEEIAKRQREFALKAIRECANYAAKRDVKLLLEPINRYETNFINTLEEGLSFIQALSCSNVMLLPDTFHMNIEEASMKKSIIGARGYVSLVHFADSNRLAPGCGHIDFPAILNALKEIGYSGFICAEILPKPDDLTAATSAAQYFDRLRRCI